MEAMTTSVLHDSGMSDTDTSGAEMSGGDYGGDIDAAESQRNANTNTMLEEQVMGALCDGV